MTKRHLIILYLLLTSASLLIGQPVKDTCLIQKRLEAERLPDMNLSRSGHNVFYVNGELTVVGGHTSGFVMTPTAEYFSNGEWHIVPTVYPHDNGMAIVLDEGKRVLVAGGHEKGLGIGQSYEAEMYDPMSHTFQGFGCLDRKRALAQGVELDSGRVLITGNHQGNDAFEMFDGQRSFRHIKDITSWRSAPYLLPMAHDEVIVFGAVWRDGRFQPCDTVDRLKGEPFRAPLLEEWIPMLYDHNSHATAAFMGDYSYLVAAQNGRGEVAFIQVHDTVFSLLPIDHPVPMKTEWGSIKYDRSAIVDPQTHRAYLVGNDTTGRAYVVAVEYNQSPASLTLYYTDPLEDFGYSTPVLTPDGDLIIAGGSLDDNFVPFSSVWLLHTGTPKTASTTETRPNRTWLWVLCGLLGVVAVVYLRRFASLTNVESDDLRGGTTKQSRPQPDNTTNELLNRITQLMETQHLYLNPELKITDVAEALGTNRNAISACINAQGSTFSQLVNDYRLQHAKELLRTDSSRKMATIGLESGFANERSFFRVFKEATGMPPKEWAAQQTGSN